MDFSEVIRSARKAQHLSQEELARKAGLSYRTVWNIEQGGSIPRGSTRRALVEALDLDLADIADEDVA